MFNLLFGLLLMLRFWQLGLKPAHHDESINGWFVIDLWKSGRFIYDPTNYHGPLLFYLFQAAEAIGGFGVESFRAVTVLFSILTMLWLWQWTQRRFNLSGWWLLALALSPGYLFFSRSAIHEPVLIFFLVMATTAWLDVWCLRRAHKAPVFLYGLLGMLLIKETFVIPVALAVVCTAPLLIKAEKWRELKPQAKRLGFHFILCVLIWVAFYSSFGANPKGLLDFFAAFLPWMKTGTQGHGHEKEFLYFVKLMWNNEAASIVALTIVFLGLLKNHWVRWLCFWALGNLAFYSFIPYKTPWCLLAVQIPLWVAAIVVVAKSNFVLRWAGQIVLLAAALINLPTFSKLNFHELKDPHPYVYVQASPQTKKFAESLLRQAEERPAIRQQHLLFATGESWPFPWWLSKYPNQLSAGLEFWKPENALLLVDENQQEQAEEKLSGEFWKVRFLVRDSRIPAVAYLRKSVFECPLDVCDEVKK